MPNCIYVSSIFPPHEKEVNSLEDIRNIIGSNNSLKLYQFPEQIFNDVGIIARENEDGSPVNKFNFIGDFLFVGTKKYKEETLLRNLNDPEILTFLTILDEYEKLKSLFGIINSTDFIKGDFYLD